jgi:hypothetical protein
LITSLTPSTEIHRAQRPLHALRRQPRRRTSRLEFPPRPRSHPKSRHQTTRLPSSQRRSQFNGRGRSIPASLLGKTTARSIEGTRLLESLERENPCDAARVQSFQVIVYLIKCLDLILNSVAVSRLSVCIMHVQPYFPHFMSKRTLYIHAST